MSKARQKARKQKGRPTQKKNPVWLISYSDMVKDCLRSVPTRSFDNGLIGIKLDDRDEQKNDKRNSDK